MDNIDQLRIRAHARSADAHSRSAEFQIGLAAQLHALGNHTQASTARELADVHRKLAKRERAFAR